AGERARSRRSRQGSPKTEAASWERTYGVPRALSEGPANIDHALGEGPVCDDGVAPHRVQQLLLADEPAVMLEQVAEHLEGLPPQPDLVAAFTQSTAVDVERELAEGILALADAGRRHFPCSRWNLLPAIVARPKRISSFSLGNSVQMR